MPLGFAALAEAFMSLANGATITVEERLFAPRATFCLATRNTQSLGRVLIGLKSHPVTMRWAYAQSMSLNLKETDLGGIASDLRRSFRDRPPTGYVLGKTAIRDAIVKKLDCSALEAEQVVDTMIARGFLRYQGSPSEVIDDPRPWAIDTQPSMS